MKNGKFIISLDFELHWGVRDKKTIAQYGTNIIGVHSVIPKLLLLFSEYHIKATFATVGFLFFKNKKELLENIPDNKPSYVDENLSPYNGHFNLINEGVDKFHFADDLISQIKKYPSHEIGTHTYSHYYCLEDGQNITEFEEDLQFAIKVGKQNNIVISSLVFPRNQYNNQYLAICAKHGIVCIRGNEKNWLYTARKGNSESAFRRAFRLVDAYINVSGNHCYTLSDTNPNLPLDIPASRFLRPFSNKLKFLEKLRLQRILKSMTYAAKNNKMYHLWWHPHNFGINQTENLSFLTSILIHYQKLNQQYNFESQTMTSLAHEIKNS
jgi:peptidoglycan/xylan/chitin deacetylase (PgdA/CDA1 family)